MPIDTSIALGAELPEKTFSWTSSDVLLYHLGIGAGTRENDHVNPKALRYLHEGDKLQVLPSFGVVVPTFNDVEPPSVQLPGCDLDLQMVLHASQEITVHRPIPTDGTATLKTQITEVWDKGKAAVIVREGKAIAPDGEHLWTVRSGIFVRNEGGWGGERGPSTKIELPTREPDAETSYTTTPQQALLYRLSGDRNPLHSDPEFAAGAGYPAPILHGLCSYGIVLREVTDLLLDGDAAKVGGFSARFAGVAFPGDTIRIQTWNEDGRILISATIADGERAGSPVLADCVLTPA